MKKKLGNIFIPLAGALLVLVTSLATATQPVDASDIRAATENATTQRAHEGLAKYYEDTAAQVQEKVEEKKELLEHYEYKSYLYGRRAQDLQSQTHALIRNYERTVRANLQAAALHRQIASQLNETQVASGMQAHDDASGL